MLNVRILKSKMVLAGDENFVNCLARLLAITRQTAGAKLNGDRDFTHSEIALISKHYGFTDEELKQFIEGEDDNESERRS